MAKLVITFSLTFLGKEALPGEGKGVRERTEKPDPGVGTMTPKFSISPFSHKQAGGGGGGGGCQKGVIQKCKWRRVILVELFD